MRFGETNTVPEMLPISLDNPNLGAGNDEDSSFATGVTSLSLSQIVRQDHRIKLILVMAVVSLLS